MPTYWVKLRKNNEMRLELNSQNAATNYPDELKNKMARYEKDQASVESLIDDAALKNNLGFNGLDPLKRFLSLDPPKLTAEQKDWIDMNSRLNVIGSYCYTISDRLPEKQKDCEHNTPYKIAKDVDNLLYNMCVEKTSKEVNMDLRDTSYQSSPDRGIMKKYSQSLGVVRESFESVSYYKFWERTIYAKCHRDYHKSRFKPVTNDLILWCVPDPTDEAHNYKLRSSQEILFKSEWLNPGMVMMDSKPRVLECRYGADSGGNGMAHLYFWPHNGVPSGIVVRNKWGGGKSYPLSDEGYHGEKLAYDFLGDGHYLGLEAVDECPTDLEKAIRLRQKLILQVLPSYLAKEIVGSSGSRGSAQPPSEATR